MKDKKIIITVRFVDGNTPPFQEAHYVLKWKSDGWTGGWLPDRRGFISEVDKWLESDKDCEIESAVVWNDK